MKFSTKIYIYIYSSVKLEIIDIEIRPITSIDDISNKKRKKSTLINYITLNFDDIFVEDNKVSIVVSFEFATDHGTE